MLDDIGGIAALMLGIQSVTALVHETFDMIVGNPMLVVFASGGLLMMGIRIFRKLRGVAW